VLRISKASLCVLLVCCVVHVYKAEVFASKVASRVCVCAREPHPVYIDLSFPLSFLFSFFSLQIESSTLDPHDLLCVTVT
jgi:hypothetical protein